MTIDISEWLWKNIILGQKLFLPENSDFPIFTISVKLEDREKIHKRGTHWLGQGFKIYLNENWSKMG